MNRGSLPIPSQIYKDSGFPNLGYCEEPIEDESPASSMRERIRNWIGHANSPTPLGNMEVQRTSSKSNRPRLREDEVAPQSEIKLASFVESYFVPGHVKVKRLAGRVYYQAILKHVLLPEEVDRIFQSDGDKSKNKLKGVLDWPYLGDLRLQDCGPEHVERLISAAVTRGYSVQTVVHIRNVVSAIFSHAKKMMLYDHDNPAKKVMLPERPPKTPHRLTLSQANDVLMAMRYPEKEMSLIAMFTSMNVAEICGLQWKYVNLTGAPSNLDGEMIPPVTFAVRKRWYRGELDGATGARAKNYPIPYFLLPMLLKLSGREKHTGPNDFVLVSRTGTPINAINITARRLRAIGKELEMPWLTWHVFRRSHRALEDELGEQFKHHLAGMFHSDSARGIGDQERRSQLAQRERAAGNRDLEPRKRIADLAMETA